MIYSKTKKWMPLYIVKRINFLPKANLQGKNRKTW